VKKVIILVQQHFPYDIRVRKLTDTLVQHGHAATVICLRNGQEPEFEVINQVRVYRISLAKKRTGKWRYLFEYMAFLLAAFWLLNKLDRNEHFDTVHVCTLPDFLVFACIIQKFKGTRILLDMHEIMPEFFMSKYNVGKNNLFVRLLLVVENLSLKFSDEVIAINDPVKTLFQRRAIPGKPIHVIMNTVNERYAAFIGKKPHQRLNCVYHGTITTLYGLDGALKAFARAAKACPDMFFNIFGEGPQVNELKALSRELGIESRVLFKGQVPHNRMMELLAEMDLGILALPGNEFMDLSFSNKLAEYIQLKIPVIISDLDAIMYYFDKNDVLFFKAGELDDLADKIRFAYTHRDIIRNMAVSAFEKYKAIDWTIMSVRYLRIIES
jgi:glycosyltransferase involved in cell wall biosynthesis